MRALLSVSNREGIVEFARGLLEAGVECYATDGTRDHLAEHGVEVASVTDLTDFPEILGGRVKTLHPAVFAGLLARRDNSSHMAQLAEHGLSTIDVVAVNLYPLADTVLEPARTLHPALQQHHLGGHAPLRAPAEKLPARAVLRPPS